MNTNVVLMFQADDTAVSDIENYIASRGYEIKKVNNTKRKNPTNIIDFGEHYHFNLKSKETFYKNKKIKSAFF